MHIRGGGQNLQGKLYEGNGRTSRKLKCLRKQGSCISVVSRSAVSIHGYGRTQERNKPLQMHHDSCCRKDMMRPPNSHPVCGLCTAGIRGITLRRSTDPEEKCKMHDAFRSRVKTIQQFQAADLLDNFHVGEIIAIADAGVMLCCGKMMQEASRSHAALELASWRRAIRRCQLLPDLAQQPPAHLPQLPPGTHQLQQHSNLIMKGADYLNSLQHLGIQK